MKPRTVLVALALLLLAQRGKAERIVVGVVEESDSYWKGNLIHTDYVLRAGDERIAFTLPGGTIGDETHGTSWSIPLEQGGRYLLYLGGEGSPPIAVPETVDLVESLAGEKPDLRAIAEKGLRAAWDSFVIRNPAVPPISVNPVPSPFSHAGRDQAEYWNVYAPGLFRIQSPSASWSFGNGVSDIAGLVDDDRMQKEFGQAWFPGGVSLISYRLEDDHIVEADIALNPSMSWTLDEDAATRLGGPRSFRQAVLAGLGFAWGLGPSFSLARRDRESVLGIAPQQYKMPTLFSDDTAAVRSVFGGANIRDGLMSAYSLQPAAGRPIQIPVTLSARSVPPGGRVQVGRQVKIENTGTQNLTRCVVEVYLVPRRFSMQGAVLLKRVRVSGTIAPGVLRNVAVGQVVVPGSTPPGSYFLAFRLRAPGDEYAPNDFAWSDSTVALTVKAR